MRTYLQSTLTTLSLTLLASFGSAQEFPDFFDESDRSVLEAAAYRPAEFDSLAPKVKKGTVNSEYNRAGLTIIHLNTAQSNYARYTSVLYDSLLIPTKYDDNNVGIKQLLCSLHDTTLNKGRGFEVPSGFFKNMFSKKKPEFFYNDLVGESLARSLSEAKVPNAIYTNWFEVDRSSSTMGIGTLQQRAAFNATDADVAVAEAMSRGVNEVLDQYNDLVNSSYILLMHYHDIMNEAEFAKKQQEGIVKIQSNVDKGKGFVGEVSGYLFKVDFSEPVQQAFYDELWPDENEPELIRKLRIKAFDDREFPVQFVGKIDKDLEVWEKETVDIIKNAATTPKPKSKQELLNTFSLRGLNAVMSDYETLFEAFQTKTTVFERKPIVAKIGMKESLRPDQRFFVWEFREKKDGTTFAKRKGVVRATNSIFDNSLQGAPCDDCPGGYVMAVCDTCISKFYQVAGKKIDRGMLMQQKNDLGISATLGYTYGGIGGPFLRVEYNTAQLLGRFMKKTLLGMKIYVGGGLDFKQYNDGVITAFGTEAGKGPKGQSFFNVYGGFQKEFYFARNFSAGVEFGIGYEGASWKDTKASFGTVMLLPGFSLATNILHNLQVVLGARWAVTEVFTPTGKSASGADVVFNKGIHWGDVYDGGWFKRRTGPQISLGIRYNY